MRYWCHGEPKNNKLYFGSRICFHLQVTGFRYIIKIANVQYQLANLQVIRSAHRISQNKIQCNNYRVSVIWGFRREVDENCAILTSDSWPLKMGPVGCPETSVRNYHYSLCSNPKEHNSQFKISSVFSKTRGLFSLLCGLYGALLIFVDKDMIIQCKLTKAHFLNWHFNF